MSAPEDHMRRIQLAACQDPLVRLFRNNVGQGWVGEELRRFGNCVTLANARVIRFGLGVGTGDLIGGKSTLITPEMIGRYILRFANIEVKQGSGRATAEQKAFIETVKSLGGIAAVVRSEDDARKVLTLDSL